MKLPPGLKPVWKNSPFTCRTFVGQAGTGGLRALGARQGTCSSILGFAGLAAAVLKPSIIIPLQVSAARAGSPS
ncbi:MAG: hypothetical protein KME26_28275 [Oscillatoria princeps RMCB-10]|nr:hypothetical protein [Oscillatoria princeps RMCB-10]